MFDPDYHNLNHASFGTIPHALHQSLSHYQSLHERRPDQFIRYTYSQLLDTNRAAAARLLHAPSLDTVVFVPNATTGINAVLRALAEAPNHGPNDEILYFSTVYGACGKTIDWAADATAGALSGRAVELTYPISNEAILARFEHAVAASKAAGKTPKVALFDTVSSVPGVRFPYEALTAACRAHGILSLVDAAQGIGMIPLSMAHLDPDFLVTNAHKWLFVPRACAALYVPVRNQDLIRSTVPTSHGYVPRDEGKARVNPLGQNAKGRFVAAFEYVGTLDNSPYLCFQDAVAWRERVLGGEERIMEYVNGLARDGGQATARGLRTWVLETEGECGMVNVALPVVVIGDGEGSSVQGQDGGSIVREADVEGAAPVARMPDGEGEAALMSREGEVLIPHEEAERIWEWMTKVLVDDYKTFIPLFYHAGRFWARLSAQVYLDLDDFVWAGKTLKLLCERVARKEYDVL